MLTQALGLFHVCFHDADRQVMLQVQAAACSVFDGIIERQALVEKARQENQLAARYKSVLGFSARLQAFCKSSQYGQVLPAYQQATALIQVQATADVQSTVDWSVLQSLVDQVTSCCNLLLMFQHVS